MHRLRLCSCWKRKFEAPYNREASKRKTFQVNSCGYATSLNTSLRQHIISIHEKKNCFQYKEENSTSVKSYMKNHVIAVHEKSRRFKCNECNFTSSRNVRLVRHIKSVHLQEKFFQCTECDYSAFHNCDLILHIKSRKELSMQWLQLYSLTKTTTYAAYIISASQRKTL